MQLKKYKRDQCISVWSNSKAHGQLLACASPNPTNSNLSDLQILSVDLADPSKNLKLEGRGLYNSPYRCLAWGSFGQKQGVYPYGVIFGGMENGSFTLWNPAEIIGHTDHIQQSHIDEQSSILFAEQPQEDGCAILCAQWNSLKNNYLAFGSTTLLILDVAKDITSPAVLTPASPHEGYITSVSWNKQVPHILASAGNDGLIALYDLKASRSIFSFKDNSNSTNSRNVQIAWSKHISTQIAVTFDDQKKNQLQIWDLRNQKGPIVVIDQIHTKGINTMDWSQLDHDLILTASRDNQIVCWNYKQEQPLIKKKAESQVAKLAWSKALPSIYSVTTFDSVSICSLDDTNIHSYIPKWLKVSASSTFNGSQNIVSFLQERGNTMQQYIVKPQIKKQLSQEIAILQQFLQHQNIESLKEAEGQTGEFWKLISIKKNQQSDSDIYEFLGLDRQKILKQLQKYTGKKRDSFSINSAKSPESKKKAKPSKAVYVPISMTQADSIFGLLGQGTQTIDKSFNKNDQQFQNQNVKYETVQRNFNWDIGKQRLIKQNMLIGNYQGAIDAALKCGRTAQALIIAYSMDQTVFNSTLKTFFTETTDNFISGILRYIAFKDTEQLVKKYDLTKWKQCIALIFSLSSTEKRRNLLSLLAKRLNTQYPQSQQFINASVYSYILAEQFEEIVEIYQKRLNKYKLNSNQRKIQLTILGTRLFAISTTLTTSRKISYSFERIIKQLAFVCLEANKKLLSYSLFTKLTSQSSNKYIDYLINNTQQLSSYRNQSTPVFSLPVMNKRQETKKNTKRQEIPVNIKPSKQQKGAQKAAFQQPENDTKYGKSKQPIIPPPPHRTQRPETIPPGPPLPPPPPPPPSGSQSQSPFGNSQVRKGSNIPPPPPPGHQGRKPPSQAIQQQQTQQQQKSFSHHAPPPAKKANIPPPPAKVVARQPNTPVQQPQPPAKKNNPPPPPPPPPPSSSRGSQKQQIPVAPSRSNNPMGGRNPPPPPPSHSHSYAAKKQVDEEQQIEKQEVQPMKKAKNPPPPPPPKSLGSSQGLKGSQPPPPPPPAKQPIRVNEPEQDQDQQQEQQPQPRSQKIIPPPPKSTVQPPPPVKKVTAQVPPPPKSQPRQQVVQNYQEQQQVETTQSQPIQKRIPPQPPSSAGRKAPPPPPPRR